MRAGETTEGCIISWLRNVTRHDRVGGWAGGCKHIPREAPWGRREGEEEAEGEEKRT